VVHLPLRPEFADKFDEAAAWAWFRETDGMPYGYRNFLFSWIDTEYENYPAVLDIDFVMLAFRLLEKISPYAGDLLI
jgi:hypothetical protein